MVFLWGRLENNGSHAFTHVLSDQRVLYVQVDVLCERLLYHLDLLTGVFYTFVRGGITAIIPLLELLGREVILEKRLLLGAASATIQLLDPLPRNTPVQLLPLDRLQLARVGLNCSPPLVY